MKMTFSVSNDKSPQESQYSYSSNTSTNSDSAFTSVSNSASSSPSSQLQTPSHATSEKTLLKRMGKYLRKALHVGSGRRKQQPQQQRQTQISPDLSSGTDAAADIAIIRASPMTKKTATIAAEQQQQQQQQPSTDVPSLEEDEWEELESRMDKLLRRLAHNNGRKKSKQSKAATAASDSALARLLDEELPLDMLPLTGALHVLRRYQVLDANVLIVAWAFFRRLVQSAAKVRSLQRLLFVCIVLAAKYHLDSTVNSAIFTRLARIPPVWLARTEYAAWAALDMACFVSPAEYAAAAKDLAIPL